VPDDLFMILVVSVSHRSSFHIEVHTGLVAAFEKV